MGLPDSYRVHYTYGTDGSERMKWPDEKVIFNDGGVKLLDWGTGGAADISRPSGPWYMRYHLTVDVAEGACTGSGDTINEALENLRSVGGVACRIAATMALLKHGVAHE